MANDQNLKPFKPGQSGNPAGRPKGIPNRSSVINYLLLEADINDLGVIKNKPDWFDKVRPKTLYEVMTISMAIKALNGDVRAYNALNKALDATHDTRDSIQYDVVHIYKPEQLSIDEFNAQGETLRRRAEAAVHGT